ncbi:MAG: TonB-dependent receptor [Caulobacteraceae bacterium]|nr:TonB-dependent receptor [Caulobacteraceae bacterium]
MSNRHLNRASALALAAAFLAVSTARAEEAADQPHPVSGVTVTAGGGSLTQPDLAQQKSELIRTAGSVGFIDADDLKGRYANTLHDMLKDAPGVFAQNRYGQEVRLSIRGSGVARGYHLRGVEIAQDGVPWNLADGSGDFYTIDPLSLRSIEVYKGGNGLALGSSTLGGAINFVTPTAYTATTPNVLRLEGGSFSTMRASATASRVFGDWDALATVTGLASAGARQHSRSTDLYFNGNIGHRFNDRVETRVYVAIDDTRQQLPGSLPLAQALAHPDQAAPGAANMVVGGNQQRNDAVQRIADRTTVKLDEGRIDVTVWAAHKHLDHPIFQVLNQDGWTWGGDARYSADLDIGGLRNEVIAGMRVIAGFNQAKQYVNLAGSRGAMTGNAHQKAFNVEAYAEDRIHLTQTVALTVGGKYLADERELDNLTTPAKSGERTFHGFSPKAGLLWQATPSVQVFANLTRSRDVPDFTDLAQANTAGPSFAPLDAQRAWTYEIGARGDHGPVHFDLTAYRAEINGELLQYTVDPNVPATTFNAGRTVHQGIEALVRVDLAEGLSAPDAGDRLSVTGVWNFNDFRFRGDRQYGNNAIAGAPRNVLRAEIRYTRPDLLGLGGFYIAPNVDWVPQGAWVDQANTLRAPGYTLVGLETGLDLRNGLSLYVEGRNLTDEAYVSDVSTITDARKAGTSVFYPGEGRSVFAGLRYAF